jgi:hypothetical protein
MTATAFCPFDVKQRGHVPASGCIQCVEELRSALCAACECAHSNRCEGLQPREWPPPRPGSEPVRIQSTYASQHCRVQWALTRMRLIQWDDDCIVTPHSHHALLTHACKVRHNIPVHWYSRCTPLVQLAVELSCKMSQPRVSLSIRQCLLHFTDVVVSIYSATMRAVAAWAASNSLVRREVHDSNVTTTS